MLLYGFKHVTLHVCFLFISLFIYIPACLLFVYLFIYIYIFGHINQNYVNLDHCDHYFWVTWYFKIVT